MRSSCFQLGIRGVTLASAALFASVAFSPVASAFDLDWSGQFRSEAWTVRNYAFSQGVGAGGYTVSSSGDENTYFQTLFMKFTPKAIVNDNVILKSEWWMGDAALGMFGDSAPYLSGNRWVTSSQSRGAVFSVQRLWAELLTDFGTVQVGRMPLHWGLGAVWNKGEALNARAPSTGDAVRLVAKFGSFSLAPAFIKYGSGNTIGGSCSVDEGTGVCTSTDGLGGVTDYSMVFRYENVDEDLEGGVNFIRRIARSKQDPEYGYLPPGGVSGSSIFNTWDLYFRKKWGSVELSAEAPIVSGSIGSFKYDTIAVAGELKWTANERFALIGKGGLAPGQAGGVTLPTDFRAYSLHPDYRVGLVMFNLQPANFSGPTYFNHPEIHSNEIASPFDAPIVNARYGSVEGRLDYEKWVFTAETVFAFADQTAKAGEQFYNTRSRSFVENVSGVDQSSFMGWELDLGAELKWDDQVTAGVKAGWFVPGDYFAFANGASAASLKTVFAASATLGVTF